MGHLFCKDNFLGQRQQLWFYLFSMSISVFNVFSFRIIYSVLFFFLFWEDENSLTVWSSVVLNKGWGMFEVGKPLVALTWIWLVFFFFVVVLWIIKTAYVVFCYFVGSFILFFEGGGGWNWCQWKIDDMVTGHFY